MADAKVAIVTGAGSGVGRATAILLGEAGYRVVLVARSLDKLEETGRLVAMASRGKEGVEAVVMPTDLTDAAATRAIVEKTMRRFSRIDAIANVAGQAPSLPIRDVTPEIYQGCMDANLSYVVHLTAAAWPVFTKQKSGVIVNVSSMASFDPFPGLAIYAAAKVGVNMLTRCIASEGQEIGLKSVCIAPGAIETPMLRSLFDKKAIPTDKTLDPKEVAGLIRDCITGTREFKSGETIPMPSP